MAAECNVEPAVRALAGILRSQPEFQAYMEAAHALDAEETVQDLLRQIRSHQLALQWGQGERAEHRAALVQLQDDLAAQPAVQSYYRDERALRELFQAVDAAISAAAGVDLAANARRSCCG